MNCHSMSGNNRDIDGASSALMRLLTVIAAWLYTSSLTLCS
jgi:hypothetical protein